ncbi:MAG TPA: Uma2 family endonuclease [Chloroflexota bacterium]|nr:Uma2 family endonuclease [Chloroflexota bacterium]
MVKSLRWTIEDLEVMPEDGKLREIIDGELYVSTQPHFNHQLVSSRLIAALTSWNEHLQPFGAVVNSPGLIFSRYDAVAPDIVWISKERLQRVLDDRGHLRAAPQLVVEVLSPGGQNKKRDREAKLTLYSRDGVDEYWIVDWRERVIDVYRREPDELRLVARLANRDPLESPNLPGFTLAVGALFEGLPTGSRAARPPDDEEDD